MASLKYHKMGSGRTKRDDKNATGYLSFLEDIKCNFSHLQPPSIPKTLAKAIDEFNYVKITLRFRRNGGKNKQQNQSSTG